ncbi:NAD(P)/FAD-dependent oxidoreductase, partial [Intestinibacter sp.]|uniref:NAD(P)/FAD-dependent oxidoreductase n=1 Tax=Intestinibacter sp. TaxID=1965304 RepID=UPI002A765AA3
DGEFAMWSKSTGILNPFLLTIALAENAAANGVEYYFGNEVVGIERIDEVYNIKTVKDTYKTRWVVNAAGLYSDKVAKMLGIDDYTIHPCRGEYFILDEKVGSKLSLPAYPVPNPKEGGLGIHLTPTIDGNVFIGPSSEYIDERDDYSATQKIMDLLIKDGGRIFPHINRGDFIRNFAGIRPKLASKEEGGYHDFVIERREEAPNTINLVGIESPGLTSSTPIAKYVVSLMKEKEELTVNESFNPIRKPIVTFADKSIEEKEALIKENPDYGEVICRCQTITKAEILQAINNPLGVETLTGIKYRCRAMMGRCQGGYCETRIAGLLEEVKHKDRKDVLYSRENSNMFVGKVRD